MSLLVLVLSTVYSRINANSLWLIMVKMITLEVPFFAHYLFSTMIIPSPTGSCARFVIIIMLLLAVCYDFLLGSFDVAVKKGERLFIKLSISVTF